MGQLFFYCLFAWDGMCVVCLDLRSYWAYLLATLRLSLPCLRGACSLGFISSSSFLPL
uniref:Uncharacterized protein n=1 Tax=Picea glauca TaxID=3330 RepID=A0A117NFS7_PICGL|nr:hypothetical protein ABT39_MTgene2276 [Picea glauca]QHR88334.1 hypothetical protein Q903MT_gene2347 [Picea sitchensis]